jgi:hypothetical protein
MKLKVEGTGVEQAAKSLTSVLTMLIMAIAGLAMAIFALAVK